MGRTEHADGRLIEPVFWDGGDDGARHPVVWKRTLVPGQGKPVQFGADVTIEYELQAHEIGEFPTVTSWFQLLDNAARSDTGGWPERLKRGQGQASTAENPRIDPSTGGPPFQFTVGSGVIEGLSDIVSRMRLGEEVEAWLHPSKAYHAGGHGAIPENALIHFSWLKLTGASRRQRGGCMRGAAAPAAATVAKSGSKRLYEGSLLYPAAEFERADLSHDLVLNISGEDTPRPGWDRKQLDLYDKVFVAAEASERHFRRRNDAIMQAHREQNEKIVATSYRILRDARFRPWRDLSKLEQRHALQHRWTKTAWETERKVNSKEETEAALAEREAKKSGQWRVDPTMAALIGREVVQTMDKKADRVTRDFQLYGSNQRYKSPYLSSVTELPPTASWYSPSYWHALNPWSSDLCFLGASYLPCCRVHMYGLPNDVEGRMRECSFCGLDMLFDSELSRTWQCCIPFSPCSPTCLQHPYPNPKCVYQSPFEMLHMARQGESDNEGRMGEIRNHALNFGTAKARGETDSESRQFMSTQLVLLSLSAQALCVYTVFVIFGGGDWHFPAFASDATETPEAEENSIFFIVGFWILVGSVASRVLILCVYYNPFLEPALLHRRPDGLIEEIWEAFVKMLDEDAKESFVRDALRNDSRCSSRKTGQSSETANVARPHETPKQRRNTVRGRPRPTDPSGSDDADDEEFVWKEDSEFWHDRPRAGLSEVDRLKGEGNWFIEWANQMDEAEKPLKALLQFLDERVPESTPHRNGRHVVGPYDLPEHNLDLTLSTKFVVHPYSLKVHTIDSRAGQKLQRLSADGSRFPEDPEVRAWMAGSAYTSRREGEVLTHDDFSNVLRELNDGFPEPLDGLVPCSLHWYVVHCSLKIKRMWEGLDVYLKDKWYDLQKLFPNPDGERLRIPGCAQVSRGGGCMSSPEVDVTPTWMLLIDRRGTVYWRSAPWPESQSDKYEIPAEVVDPFHTAESVSTEDRQALAFVNVLQRFLTGTGTRDGRARMKLCAHAYIQRRFKAHDSQTQDASILDSPRDFITNYIHRIASKAECLVGLNRSDDEIVMLTDMAEFRTLAQWLQAFWGCTNLRKAASTAPSKDRRWFYQADGKSGTFAKMRGTKRLELCRKALMFLHVQRTDRKFTDAEGRNLHDITPPTMGESELHTLKQIKRGVAHDLVRVHEDYRSIEDLFAKYRQRRDFFEKFLRSHGCGSEQDDFPTTDSDFAVRNPANQASRARNLTKDDKFIVNWQKWCEKYKSTAPKEFKVPEILQLLYDIAQAEHTVVRVHLADDSPKSRSSSQVIEEKTSARQGKEEELRTLLRDSYPDFSREDVDTEIATLRKKFGGPKAAERRDDARTLPSAAHIDFALACIECATAIDSKRMDDDANTVAGLKDKRLALLKEIRKESPDFKWRKTKTFAQSVDHLWEVEIQIAEREIPHFVLSAEDLLTEQHGSSSRDGRDVIWDLLDEAIQEWDSLDDSVSTPRASNELRKAEAIYAKLDMDRHALRQAREYATLKRQSTAANLFADTWSTLSKALNSSSAADAIATLVNDAHCERLHSSVDVQGKSMAWFDVSRRAAFSASDKESLFQEQDDAFPLVLEMSGLAKGGKSFAEALSEPFGADMYSNASTWETEIADLLKDLSEAWQRHLGKAWSGSGSVEEAWNAMGGAQRDPLVCVSLIFGLVLKIRATLRVNARDASVETGSTVKSPFQEACEQVGGQMADLDSQLTALLPRLVKIEDDALTLQQTIALRYDAHNNCDDLETAHDIVLKIRMLAEDLKTLGEESMASTQKLKAKYGSAMKSKRDALQSMTIQRDGTEVPVAALLQQDVDKMLDKTHEDLKAAEATVLEKKKELNQMEKKVNDKKSRSATCQVVGPVTKKKRPHSDDKDANKRLCRAAMQAWISHLAALWQSDSRSQGYEEGSKSAAQTWRNIVKILNDGDVVDHFSGTEILAEGTTTVEIARILKLRLRACKSKWFRDDILDDILGAWNISRASPSQLSSGPSLVEDYFVSSPFTSPRKHHRAPPTKRPAENHMVAVLAELVHTSNGTCKGIMEELTDSECAAFGLKNLRRRVLRRYGKIVSTAAKNGARLSETGKLSTVEGDPSVGALVDAKDFDKVWEFVRCKIAVNGKGVRGALGDENALIALLNARKSVLFCEYHALSLENNERQQIEFNTDVAAATRGAYLDSVAKHEKRWANFWEFFAEQVKVEAPTLVDETRKRLENVQDGKSDVLSRHSERDLESGTSGVKQWLERRPGTMYEDLIEQYSRASVDLAAFFTLWWGWITFIIDPALGLHWLDQTRLPPRANQRLEADLALYTLQNARGHAAAELQIFAVCGAIMALMICFYVDNGGSVLEQPDEPGLAVNGTAPVVGLTASEGPHTRYLFWLTASLIAAQFWRALGAASRFLRIQREILVGDSWARWLDRPAAVVSEDGTEVNRWDKASSAVEAAATMRASGARRFKGPEYDVSFKCHAMFTENEMVRELQPRIMYDTDIHPTELCHRDRAFEFRGFVPDCLGFLVWDFEIQYEMVKASTDSRSPAFNKGLFMTQLQHAFKETPGWIAGRRQKSEEGRAAVEVLPPQEGHAAAAAAAPAPYDEHVVVEVDPSDAPAMAISVKRDYNELNKEGGCTDYVRLRFTEGCQSEMYAMMSNVLRRQMSEMATPGLQFKDTRAGANSQDLYIWFRPRVYRWRFRPGQEGMTDWRPNVKSAMHLR